MTKTIKMQSSELAAEMEQMVSKILSSDSILLFPHIHMDGDCLGSAVAMCLGLRSLGKEAHVVIEDDIPANLAFLENGCCTYDLDILKEPDICMTIDCAEIGRFLMRKELFLKGKATMCVDHHSTSRAFAQYNYIDSSAAATGELIYKFLMEMQVTLDVAMGECIYAAITTDTGNFQYSNTTKATHEIIAHLYDVGINHSKVSEEIYQSIRVEKLLMTSISLSSMRLFANGRLAIACLKQKDLEATGATMDEAEGIVETMRSIQNVEIAVILKEHKDGKVKASLRSKKDFDVAKFSARFGGGGHVKAAGFNMDEPIEKCVEIISEALIKEMDQGNND